MPFSLQNTQATQPSPTATTFAAADTTVAKSVFTQISGPWHLVEVTITSDDTAAAVVDIFARIASTNFLLGSVAVPAGTGKAGVATASFLKNNFPDTLQGLDFPSAVTLQAAMEATITAAKTVTVVTWALAY